MRGDLALMLFALTPVLMAPKGCYYGSDVVPLGYNVGGNGFGDDAGAPSFDESGGCSGRAGGDGPGPAFPTGGSDAATAARGGTASAGALSMSSGGVGGTTGGNPAVIIVLRPH